MLKIQQPQTKTLLDVKPRCQWGEYPYKTSVLQYCVPLSSKIISLSPKAVPHFEKYCVTSSSSVGASSVGLCKSLSTPNIVFPSSDSSHTIFKFLTLSHLCLCITVLCPRKSFQLQLAHHHTFPPDVSPALPPLEGVSQISKENQPISPLFLV